MTTEQKLMEINRLTAFWYDFVGIGGHKDCDCHFEIAQRWSYGAKSKWVVRHYGYVYQNGTGEKPANDYESALTVLILTIQRAITQEKKWSKDVLDAPQDYDEYQRAQAIMVRDFVL